MAPHECAGKPAPRDLLVHVPRLVSAYYTRHPDPDNQAERVSFGTSGHRGSALKGSFNEDHIAAVSAAVVEHRNRKGIDGPLFLGSDTHALSEPARATALEVFAAAGVEVRIQEGLGYTPTPVISHAILTHNRGRTAGLADGVVITPSHNPPEDGGFKYNPPHGGPADTLETGKIERRANEILAKGIGRVKRMPLARALTAETTRKIDYVRPYVADLGNAIDLEAVAGAGVKLGVDPLGGAAVEFWSPIAERYGLDLTVVNDAVDPTFGFMTVDGDGKIRMDCSSPSAMAGLIGLKDRFDLAFGNDPDVDRHGIVTPAGGLMNPNHFLAVAIDYLFTHRPGWAPGAAVGKTLVSTSMIDRIAAARGLLLQEVPVGFKWFVAGLAGGDLGFGGEESAGASFLRRDGTVWTTDKDGILLGLLACEILAVTGQDPSERYKALEKEFGASVYERIDAPATPAEKEILRTLSAEAVTADTLAGDPITARLSRAPGNDAPIGGLKVVTDRGWFAVRPSGTENVYKLYAESFGGEGHLARIQDEAKQIVADALKAG